MKVLIVFLSLLLVFSMALSYAEDMHGYMRAQRLLKMLAEDCAEAGALTIDEKSEMIDAGKALAAAEEILISSAMFPSGSVYISSYEVTREGKGFKLCLLYAADDFFRLPFIDISSVSRISEYAWE